MLVGGMDGERIKGGGIEGREWRGFEPVDPFPLSRPNASWDRRGHPQVQKELAEAGDPQAASHYRLHDPQGTEEV